MTQCDGMLHSSITSKDVAIGHFRKQNIRVTSVLLAFEECDAVLTIVQSAGGRSARRWVDKIQKFNTRNWIDWI